MPNRSTTPAISHAVDYDFYLPPITTYTMPNGMPLYVYSGGTQKVIELCIVVDAGIWQEPQGGVAGAVAALLRNGTSKMSAFEINDTLEFYGASLKVSVQNDFAMVLLHVLSKHLYKLLPLLNEVLTDAVFPHHEIDIYKTNGLQRLQVQQMQCDFVANQMIDASLFGPEHPYGRFTTKATLETINRDQLLNFAAATYKQAPIKIFMSGYIGDAEVAQVMEVLGQQERKQVLLDNSFAVQPDKERTHQIINDPNGVQAALRIGRPFPNRHHPDFAPMVLLNTLFGGYFGSRLMANIREDKGYTYGIYSSLMPNIHGGSLIIQSEVGRSVAQEAVAEVWHEMQLMRDEPVDNDELLLVKNYILGNMLGDLDGPFNIMQRWRTLILNGFDASHFYNNIHIYKTASPQQLQALAQKYLIPEAFMEIVVV